MHTVRLDPVWIPGGYWHNIQIYISPVYYISRMSNVNSQITQLGSILLTLEYGQIIINMESCDAIKNMESCDAIIHTYL